MHYNCPCTSTHAQLRKAGAHVAEQINVKPQVDAVFSIANKLRGTYQSDKYKDVIIPMTIIRRVECALESTKAKVVEQFAKNPETPDAVLRSRSGYAFYNTSEWTLEKLLASPKDAATYLRSYIKAFSPNIRQILIDLEFDVQITKMQKGQKLVAVIRKFSELDLHPETVNNVAMGYMFEEIIRRFSENAEAGDHYTPREVVHLLTKLALAEGCDDLREPGKVVKVLDMACGTGGMLTSAKEALDELCPDAEVYLYGQEVNPESHAMCLADMLIKGQPEERIQQADTMKKDCFEGESMRFVLANPPFGQPWGGKDAAEGVEKAVRDEHKLGFMGRFGAGLPATGDEQLLFMQHAISKLDPARGRACIISNGSPLFSGGTSSGESQIRRWMLEQDLIEAIVALPMDLFYNTNIGIYVFVLSKNKRPERRGKVQLIDATGAWEPMRRSLGKKRKFVSDAQADEIVSLYASFEEGEHVRILPKEEFLYKEYSVYQPMQRNYHICPERVDALAEGKFMAGMHDPAKLEELRAIDASELNAKQAKQLKNLEESEPAFEWMLEGLRKAATDEVWYDPKEFTKKLKDVLADMPDCPGISTSTQKTSFYKKLCGALSEIDKDAPVQRDRKGEVVYDPATKDIETVKLSEDVEAYFEREVYPYVPDAKWFDEEDAKSVKTGAEFPFTRYFYQYVPPEPADELLARFMELERQLEAQVKELG